MVLIAGLVTCISAYHYMHLYHNFNMIVCGSYGKLVVTDDHGPRWICWCISTT